MTSTQSTCDARVLHTMNGGGMMSQIWHRMTGPALLGLVAAVALAGCAHRTPETAGHSDETPVSVMPIEVQSVLTSDDVEVPGTVKPIREARIASKIMSKVERVTVDEGDRVERGQLLVKLDDSDLRA